MLETVTFPVEEVSPVAYYSSLATAVSWLGQYVPELAISWKDLEEPPDGTDLRLEGIPDGMPLIMAEAWSEAIDRVFEAHPCNQFPETRRALAKVVIPEGFCPLQLRHILTEKVESSGAKTLEG